MKIPRVLVLGDVMLDRYVRGRATHLASDHPCPCFTPEETIDRPGGAANVALNAAAAGADVTLLAFLGNDQEAADLEAVMNRDEYDTPPAYRLRRLMFSDPRRTTHMKTRYVCGRPARPLVRIDRPRGTTPPRMTQEDLARVDAALVGNRFDLILCADYGHGGIVRELGEILGFRQKGTPIYVDPHPSTAPEEYVYADMLKMNAAEERHLRTRCRPDDWLNAERLCVVTAGAGATRAWRGERSEFAQEIMPPTGLPVADPCGAGDVFFARFGVAMLENDLATAIRAAHLAAAVSVGREFTTVVRDTDADFLAAIDNGYLVGG